MTTHGQNRAGAGRPLERQCLAAKKWTARSGRSCRSVSLIALYYWIHRSSNALNPMSVILRRSCWR